MRKLSMFMVGAALLLSAAGLNAQSLTGQISGSVQDPSGTAVPGVKVEVRNTATAQIREAVSNTQGEYRITDLLPGTYELTATARGFKKFEQKDIVLTATERLVVRPIVLELGQLTETVTVTAQGARVQVQSAERSGLLTNEQVLDAPLIGRNIFGLLKTLPGVVDTGATLQAPADWDNSGKYINGSRANTISERLDGISSHDTGNWGGPQFTPNIESIAELKVLLTNYQAEYGHNMGGSMNTVTKSGTRDFHGGAYYFKRNEAFNANPYFNNLYNVKRPRYRYDYPGYFIGGPLIIPGVNRSREKLFFFWSQEFCPRTIPSAISRYTVPTSLERNGDFSQTVDTNGKLIPINDPLNNKQPFPKNIIPASQLDPNGKKILGIFPAPNTTDPNYTFNELIAWRTEQPHHAEILRVDWNIGPKNTFYARGLYGDDSDKSNLNASVVGNIFPGLAGQYHRWSKGLVTTLIHTFNPTLVNELTFGVNRRDQLVSALSQESLDKNDRTKLGLNLPQFNPKINPYNLLPNMSFGGVQNAPSVSYESRFPFFGTNSIWNVIDNISKVQGPHNLKAGIFIERVSRNAARGSAFNGSYAFGRDVYNPWDTNYAFANAIYGAMSSYSESDAHLAGHARNLDVEFFVQDTWRVSRRVTIDVGVRFYNIVPTWGANDIFGRFNRTAWDPAKAPQLVQPYKETPTSARVAIDPVTGKVLPAVKIGTFASGSGNIYNGLETYKEHLLNNPGFVITPRFGFAWDVFGNGKTAVRGGFGIFPGRLSGDDDVIVYRDFPPVVNTSTANYTTINDLLSTPLSRSPAAVRSIQRDFKWPTTYNWSFGIQHDIGHGTVVDIAYVGSVARHLMQSQNLNATPYGTNFLASSQDPTLPGTPLPANFLRPFRGYTDITYTEFASSSNYHSMQTQVNRRFARGLIFGLSWTWSSAMDLVDSNSTLNPFLNPHMRHYGKAGFDRTNSFAFTYSYDLPRLSQLWNNPVARAVGDHWQVSGITLFQSGAPLGLGYSLVSGADLTGAAGGGVDSRVILTGNPVLPKSDRTFLRFFDTTVVKPPLTNFGIGNASKYPIRGPGINNWDIVVLKDFPFGKDGQRRFQFRFETYNTFNHAQFSGVNTSARFDANGNQVNNLFGTLTSTRDPRLVQLGVKFYF